MSDDQPRRARVFLIDDHLAMRSGLSLLLTKSGHVICGEAETRSELLGRLQEADADVALVDLTLGDESGLDLIDDLLAHNVAVIIYSMHEDRKTVERAFVAGASGYVTKREVADVLLTALDQVLAEGGRVILVRGGASFHDVGRQPYTRKRPALVRIEEVAIGHARMAFRRGE